MLHSIHVAGPQVTSGAVLLAALWLAACGEPFTSTQPTATTTSSTSTAEGGQGGRGGRDAGVGGSGGHAAGGGPHGGEGGSGASSVGGAGGGVEPTGGAGALGPVGAYVSSMGFSISCGVPVADPVHGSFTAMYDNASGDEPGAAVVTSAALSMVDGNGNGLTWTFPVTPLGSGVVGAGQQRWITHNKVEGGGAGLGTPLPCDCCNQSVCLAVTWLVDGATVYSDYCPGIITCTP